MHGLRMLSSGRVLFQTCRKPQHAFRSLSGVVATAGPGPRRGPNHQVLLAQIRFLCRLSAAKNYPIYASRQRRDEAEWRVPIADVPVGCWDVLDGWDLEEVEPGADDWNGSSIHTYRINLPAALGPKDRVPSEKV